MTIPNTLMTMPAGYAPTNYVSTDEHTTSVHTYVTMINELQKEVSLLKDIVAKSSATLPNVSDSVSSQVEHSAQPVEVEFVPTMPSKTDENFEPVLTDENITLVELIDRFIVAKEGVVRKDTMRSYNNYAKLFKVYLNEYLPGIKA